VKRFALFLSAAMLLASGVSQAKEVVTLISADIVSVTGSQLPINLKVGDSVSLRYEYNDAGTVAHNYYLDGRVIEVPLALYPHMLSLSDANATFGDNLLTTFEEFHGTNGYQLFNSNWAWTELNGSQHFGSRISPNASINVGYMPAVGLSPFTEGFITVWGYNELTHSNFVGATMELDFTQVSTIVAAPIPEPETYAMLLAGLGLLGLTARRRKQV
jgi:hypothetical protein